jgi:2-polyprenyl-3-methyl-5-hydroxy-6-metoxy-1,4-benzoquinol methylase
MPTNASYRRAYGLKILNSSHREVRRLKREGHVPEIHGHKFWNSSYLVMDYLKTHPLPKKTRVLEVGCGWGLLSIFIAKRFGCSVTATDADIQVLPYLELHAEVNGIKVTAERSTFNELTTARLAEFDLIVGADICFWDDMTAMLYNLVRRSRRGGVGRVMIADPCRQPFSDLAERCQNAFGEDQVDLIEKHLAKPVNASGEILSLSNP